jgi:hypothetical protein
MALSLQDFINGVDMTGIPNPTAAQVNALVAQATPAALIGLTISTTDIPGPPIQAQIPDAITNPKWQKYVWIRQSAGGIVTPYVWNASGAANIYGAGFQNWTPIANVGLPAQSITTAMYGLLSITDAQIANVAWAKITGVPNFIQYTDVVPAGDLINSVYNNLTIAAGVVTTAKIAAQAVGTAQIGLNAVTSAQVTITDATALIDANIQSITSGPGLTATGPTGKLKLEAAKSILRMNDAGGAWAAFQDWFSNLVDSATSTAGYVPAVNATNNGLVWLDPSFGINSWDDNILNGASLATHFGANVNNNVTVSFVHLLGQAPAVLRPVIKCIAAGGEDAYALNDEIDLNYVLLYDVTAAAYTTQRLGVSSNATNFYISYFGSGDTLQFRVCKRDGTALSAITPANWALKVYYR